MRQKEILMNVRSSGHLKGLKPCYIFLKQNIGKIYNGTQSDFIMSLKGKTLYFQKITLFFKKLKPKEDFELNLAMFKEYALFRRTISNVLCLYDKNKNFIEIHYHKGVPDTFITEDNIARICKVLDELGIKEIYKEAEDNANEESNTEGKGTN